MADPKNSEYAGHDKKGRLERPTRVLPWMVVVLLVLVVLAAGAGYVYVVGILLGPGDPNRQALVRHLGSGLLVVATGGGLLALLIAARAQWLRERAQRYRELTEPGAREQAERQNEHNERVASMWQREREQMARGAEAQQAETTGADLASRAIEQLGSERPAVRMGALAMLERLAQQTSEYRQTVVDVVCGYLRLPTGGSEQTAIGKLTPEKTVRQTAQRLLLRHLTPTDRREQWRGLRLDLQGATLVDFDATGCVLSSVDFSGATFLGSTRFTDSVFDTTTDFTGARFAGVGVSFHGARFASSTVFERASFECPVEFDLAEFTDSMAVEESRFHADATFRGTRFGGNVLLGDVDFGGSTSFHSTAFEGDVVLVRTRFTGSVTFAESTLGGHSWFEEVRATTDSSHVFPPGYREVALDAAWVLLEHEMPEPAASRPEHHAPETHAPEHHASGHPGSAGTGGAAGPAGQSGTAGPASMGGMAGHSDSGDPIVTDSDELAL